MSFIGRVRLHKQDAAAKLHEYRLCFGRVSGILRCGAVMTIPGIRNRPVAMRVPGSSCDVLVRLGTTDIAVFNSTFRTQQYAFDLPSDPRVIVDAGAYTGLSSVYFALRYPGSQVIALEPSPSNFDLLRRNTAHLPNVVAVQAALWVNNELLVLDDPREGAWAFRIRPSRPSSGGTPGAVQGLTVDDICREFALEGISLLKLDIEGSELDLFTGQHDWLSRVDAIFAELHDRFRPGCARAFFRAVEDFTLEMWRGEAVMVAKAAPPK